MNTKLRLRTWHGLEIETQDGAPFARAEGPAEAARILRAVNAHDELMAALRMGVKAFNTTQIDPMVAFVTIEKMRAALAKAEGEAL